MASEGSMSDRVRIDFENGVADVRMVRSDKMNAIDGPMFAALADAGRALAGDASVRAVVLSGEGRAFCAGLDMGSFAAMAGGPRQGESATNELFERSASGANRAQLAAWIWQEIPVPVIAAVHGVAYGGGLQIALGADLRIVAPDAKLSVMEVKWGLIPDMSGTQTLRRLVPLDVAKELTWTGRVLTGVEAKELGLATRLSERPLDDALALAREIAGKSPDAIRAGKRLLQEAWQVPVAEGLRLEEDLQRKLIGRPNQVEAVKANLEKREPKFGNPS
jgi:enoyl-CoA hydratase/carnithine racemase